MTNKSKVIINFEKGIIRIVQGKNNAFSLNISKYDKTLMRFLIFFSEFCLKAYLIFKGTSAELAICILYTFVKVDICYSCYLDI